jgi:aspartyl-tRNA(Asn)/glutamyl-tRNA(Gln) amidotransferase subunit C
MDIMEIKDVEKLAQLARIELPDSEKEGILNDLKSILGYINQIEQVDVSSVKDVQYTLRNVMRADENPHETGANTKEIIAEMPESQDGFLKVQSIL